MELLEGGDTWKLSDRIEENDEYMHPLILDTIAYQTAQGLEEIHAKRIQHRDLKPDNILLTRPITAKMNSALWQLQKQGYPSRGYEDDLNKVLGILRDTRLAVLTDFGLAHDHHAGPQTHGRLTKQGGFSAAYHPPEMVGDNIQSRQADIFSFGMVIYILATFKFHKDAAQRGDLPVIYSNDLQRLYLRCTNDERTRRPVAPGVVSDLARILQAEWDLVNSYLASWNKR
jgi:serine/threonine protein kinase